MKYFLTMRTKSLDKYFRVFYFVLFSVFLSCNISFAEKVEDLNVNKYVNDFANVLDDSQENILNQQLLEYNASTSNQIVVVTVNNMDGDYIEHYSIKLAEKIKAGTEKNDNGVIFLISKTDRKARIEVGYGLEGALTDSIANRIMNQEIIPNFKKEDWNTGVKNGVRSIERAVQGEYKSNNIQKTHSTNSPISSFITFSFPIISLFFLFILGSSIPWFISVLGRTKSWWLGGVFGFILGLVIYLIFSATIYLIFVFLFTVIGLAFDYFISKNYKEHKYGKDKNPPDWWAGGSWGPGSGGGWGSGGFGGGGFSGGGGGFGGGGSSGSW